MWLNISKGTICQKTKFWVTVVQCQNMVSRSILRFDKFGHLQHWLSKLLEGFELKMAFSCKMDFWIDIVWLYSAWIPDILRAFFSKKICLSVMTSSMKLPYLKKVLSNLYIKYVCTTIDLKEPPFGKKQKFTFELLTQLSKEFCHTHNVYILKPWERWHKKTLMLCRDLILVTIIDELKCNSWCIILYVIFIRIFLKLIVKQV